MPKPQYLIEADVAARLGTVMSFVLIVTWPLLALPADPFSRSYFSWWVGVAFMWGHVAFIITVLYPLWEFLQPALAPPAPPPKVEILMQVPLASESPPSVFVPEPTPQPEPKPEPEEDDDTGVA